MQLLGVRIRRDTSCLVEIMSSINRSKQTLASSGCNTKSHFHQQRPANDQAYMNKDLEKILLTLGRLVGKADTGLGVVGAVTGDSDGASVIGFRVGASCFGLVSSFKR
jgi:hypothetical protein